MPWSGILKKCVNACHNKMGSSLFSFKKWNLNAMIRHFKKVRKRLSQFTILTEIHNFDWNSQFWLKFTVTTEIHNFDWNSQFWLKLTISTEFHSLDWNSQFWLNFTISSEIPNFDWNSQFGLRSHLACRSISWVRSVLVSFRTQLIDFYCKFIH